MEFIWNGDAHVHPNNQLSVSQQIQIFHIRIQIDPLPSNKGLSVPCATGCGEIMNNSHILKCSVINLKEQLSLQKLINGDIYEMKKTLDQWNNNMNEFEKITPQDSS